jgi:ABC-2 type transport system permease protein
MEGERIVADVWTVMWKEWKVLLVRRDSVRGGILNLLIFVGVFGVFMPLQMGRDWVESPMTLVLSVWVPLFAVAGVVADSFAGERERHTLETLLASRLSDRAILFGKVGAAVAYGWGLTLISLLLGLVTVNLAQGQGELLLYPPLISLSGMMLSLLGAGLAAGAGVLVSLRASTLRQAQQTLSIALMLLLFVPVFGVQALPVEWRARLARTLMAADVTKIVFIVIVVLTILDIGLLLAAMARFQRTRLILD